MTLLQRRGDAPRRAAAAYAGRQMRYIPGLDAPQASMSTSFHFYHCQHHTQLARPRMMAPTATPEALAATSAQLKR